MLAKDTELIDAVVERVIEIANDIVGASSIRVQRSKKDPETHALDALEEKGEGIMRKIKAAKDFTAL